MRGKPIVLFNGKDLSGWTGVVSPKAAGWTVKDGILTGKGRADDLITVAKFWDFELHAEYRLAARSNSGIGLRGRYELQIASDFGRPPGTHGTGALYTRVLPRVNAGKKPGEWQAYYIRLVGCEVTATLNGEKLYEKGVIDGLTGIAFDRTRVSPGARTPGRPRRGGVSQSRSHAAGEEEVSLPFGAGRGLARPHPFSVLHL